MADAAVKVPVLLGPTASGKSELCLRLAEDLGLQIISCDSRQVYRGMDIGTAKPSRSDLQRVTHWLIDTLDPSETYSAFQFREDVLGILSRLSTDGKRAIICGGTGLYFKCLSEGMGEQRPSDPVLRGEILQKMASGNGNSIFEELRAVDPEAASRIHPRDTRRVARALEVFHTTGTPISKLRECPGPPANVEFSILVVHLPRDELYERINRRVDGMAKAGLWDEFERLVAQGYGEDAPGMQCLGYRELFAVKQGSSRCDESLDKIKHNTRRYAKRQETWFRHQIVPDHETVAPGEYDRIRQRLQTFLEG
jgi:tRNA dimethylallyltransferase